MISPSSAGRFLVTARKSGSSMAPSFPRFFCSSQRQGNVEQDEEKLPVQSHHRKFWCGPWWEMRGQYAVIRKDHPKIPVYNVDWGTGLAGDTQTDKLILDIMRGPLPFWFTRAMRVKEEFKGPKTVRQTILVVGGDVEKLEAAAESINKQQQ